MEGEGKVILTVGRAAFVFELALVRNASAHGREWRDLAVLGLRDGLLYLYLSTRLIGREGSVDRAIGGNEGTCYQRHQDCDSCFGFHHWLLSKRCQVSAISRHASRQL